ncbi:MAG: hypothetical protein OHK0040_11040 [bacterium]
MIAHYGYSDASGEYFITVDTEKCRICVDKPCMTACPEHIFEAIEDDFGDEVIALKEDKRNKIKYLCASCKEGDKKNNLPCVKACPYGTIRHSW